MAGLPEIIIRPNLGHLCGSALHRLINEQVGSDVLVDQVEREQGMAQVVEHAEEEDDIELLAESSNVVDGELAILDVEIQHLGREPCLGEVIGVGVDADHTRCPSSLGG